MKVNVFKEDIKELGFGMSGVLKHLKKITNLPKIKIIIFSEEYSEKNVQISNKYHKNYLTNRSIPGILDLNKKTTFFKEMFRGEPNNADFRNSLRLLIGRKKNQVIFNPTLQKLFLESNMYVCAFSKSEEELLEDVKQTKPNCLIVSSESLLFKNKALIEKLSKFKRTNNLKILSVMDSSTAFNLKNHQESTENDMKEYIHYKNNHFVDLEIIGAENMGTEHLLIEKIPKLVNVQKDNSQIYDYLQSIFPQLPPEILDSLLQKINLEFTSLKSITSKTLSGTVGKIYFQANNKNYVFKVYPPNKNKIAILEFEVGKKINSDIELSSVCARTIYSKNQKTPLSYKDHFLILTEDVSNNIYPKTHLENILISHLNINLNFDLVHKIYVIALLHSRLKMLIKVEKLNSYTVRKDFFSWSQIEESILKVNPSFKSYLPEIKKMYHDIVSKHSKIEKDIIAHNDPKWDNFVNGYLIDFGSVHLSTPYVDIARILLIDAFKKDFSIDLYIFAYVFFRGHLDNSFSYENEVKHLDDNIFINTYERIFSESLRIARYKSIIGEKRIANYFLMTSVIMTSKIKSSYYKQLIDDIKKGIFSKLDTTPASKYFNFLKNKYIWSYNK